MEIGDIGILQGLPWHNGELAEIVDELYKGQQVEIVGSENTYVVTESGWYVCTLLGGYRLGVAHNNIRPIDDPDQDQEVEDADEVLYC